MTEIKVYTTEDALKDFLERGTEDNYLDKLQKPHI